MIKVHGFTVCDLVRQEQSGKFFFVGVYGSEIVFEQLPSPFVISLWMLLQSDKTGPVDFLIRGYMPEADAELFSFEGQFNILPGPWPALGVGTDLLVGQSGTLVISAKFGDEEWQELRTLQIKRKPKTG
ncbi:hypothetical protein ACQ3G6_17440 [Allorhizobium undicola]|uniref:hypothetical protein n=1 Tax=Allorhizobium undicola TaxID=78527 RepID=UPI003D329DBA